MNGFNSFDNTQQVFSSGDKDILFFDPFTTLNFNLVKLETNEIFSFF